MRNKFVRKQAINLMSLLGLALLVALFAPQRAAADEDDPPSRVARLGYVSGSVSFQPAGTDDWVSAVVNRPMTTGDKLWADNDSRAEMHIGSASIRIGSTTGFSFLDLTDDVTQLRITEGTLRIRVKRLDDNETFEIDTPNLAFSILRTGIYKINVNEAGDTTVVKVTRGQGEVTGGGSAYTVHSGEVGIFNGTDELNADVEGINNDEDDDFDAWAAERDHREDVSVSARYVSTDAIGYEDLDEYGGWRPTPEYGTIWFPHTAVVGWAPYHYGHWAYIAPWGYTWVDDAPWGFAPFHYGRWVTVGGVWGWVPCAPRPVEVVGVAYVRPVYAPALVAWVGGPHFGVGVGVSVGWFPLGPREVYVPSYHVSRNYVNNVNISNTTVNTTVVNNYYNTTVVNKNVNVTNVTYVNQRVPGAVTATTSQAFTSAQPVAKNVVVVNQREVATAAVNVTTPAVAPSRQAVLGSGASAAVRPPAALQARAVVAKTAPPPPPPAFAKQQQAIQANGGRPLAISQVRQIAPPPAQTAQSNVKIAPPAKPATPQNVQANRPGQPVNNANRPGAPNNANQPVNNGNRPNAPNNAVQPTNTGNRPGAPNNPPQPVNNGNRPANAQGNTPVNANQKTLNDRPASSRPAPPAVDPQLEQKHQQQVEQLRQQQDLERQKVEQQQQVERQKLEQQKADQERQQQQQQQQKLQQQQQQQQQQERQKEQQKAEQLRQQQQQQQQQQLEQKHNQQLQELEQKHAQEEQRLKQQQQQEKQQRQQPPPQQSKPAKQDKPKDEKDKPHGK